MEWPSDDAQSGVYRQDLRQAVEAMIFAAPSPVPAAEVARAFATVTGLDCTEEAVVEVVDELNERYARSGSSLRVQAWGGGYQMATAPEVSPFLQALLAKPETVKLSRSLMETLAILCYRQPVTKPELDFIRGVDCGYAVRKLTDLGLVDIVGRSDSLGRPMLYGTTDRFLEAFGLDSLDDLPSLRDIEEILDDPAFSHERARLLALEGLAPNTTEDDETPEKNTDD